MNLKISEGADPNYLIEIIKCPEIKIHPNADKLSILEVFGNTIVIGKDDYVKGELLAYFPVESCIAAEFLHHFNLFDNPALNADGVTKSYFSPKGRRVKAVSLRSIPSQGFVFKVSKLAEFFKCSEKEFAVGTSFDTVGDFVLATKYIRNNPVPAQIIQKSKVPNWVKNSLQFLPRPVRTKIYPLVSKYFGVLPPSDGIKSQLVAGQFKSHYKTEQLGRNIFLLNPDDDITISSKIHGTSGIFCNILCKKNLKFKDKLKKRFGSNVPEREYRLVYSSRNVLQNRRDGKYTDSVWGRHAAEFEGKIQEGVSLYCEILGWVNDGKQVQKGYCYGIEQGKSEAWVYRITQTDEFGKVYEFSWNEIVEFCNANGFKTVPEYYSGEAKDLFPEIAVDDKWRDNFLAALKDKYLDKTDDLCKAKVINEGVVIKINNKESKPALKFKSPLFVLGETKARDSGEENIDEEN